MKYEILNVETFEIGFVETESEDYVEIVKQFLLDEFEWDQESIDECEIEIDEKEMVNLVYIDDELSLLIKN